ncbi:MAG: hypothetical protein KKE89_06395 [Actinobacteria bacterium]|nr:hypothetical protein [Actinomycetota bacterium]MBU1866026.1 hypothetical protein [Actinomycetota bacterium]
MTTFRLSSITFAHPEVAVEDRAALALTGDRLTEALQRVHAEGVDVFVLSTCLRTEVAASGCEQALGRVLRLLYPDVDPLRDGVLRRDRDSVRHLYRVATGLDSPIVGEPEVLGQFRAALDAAQRAGSVGGLFEKTLQSAIATGKAARRRMQHVGRGSVAVAAAELVGSADHVAVFGAGAMARAAAGALRRSQTPPKITVYARRPDAVSIPNDEVLPMEEAPAALATAAVVISATGAKRELFAPEVLVGALQGRTDPLLLIDLAMPPDFTPVGANGHLRYLNVDDVAIHARHNGGAAAIEEEVRRAAAEAWAKLSNHHDVGPVIAAILGEADRAVREEVARFAGRLEGGPGDLAVINQLAQTIAHRVLHRPLSYLGSAGRGAEAAPILAEVFGVNGDR